MSFRVGVDIGGTFTDCCVVGEDGRRHLAKALTTPEALEKGVLDALGVNAERLGLTLPELLGATSRFVHSTTQATNAILTRRGARTGLITTRGHEQSLLIGNVSSKIAGLPESEILHTSRLKKPEPVVPRQLIVGLHERVDRYGDVLVALDEQQAADAIDHLVSLGIESVAVSFLWSFLRPDHEKVVKRLLQERAPHLFAAFSHEIAPVIGEYERTATTALSAYVGPKVTGYLSALQDALQAQGLAHPMLVMQASGGLTSVADAAHRPLLTLDSGPTGGVLGCRYLGSLYNEKNLICTDVGGTSFDVGLVLDGLVPTDHEPVVSQYGLRLPKVLVRSIGAGGGSIAWIDEGGLLRVGPQSAGSRPGPACYDRGGVEPTVTDADLVLGHLDADSFLGGTMALRRDLALTALSTLGERLGIGPQEVAVGISRIINAQMADLIRRSTIELGHDPRDCMLVAYGGAGPTHAAAYAADIGARAILIPADSTVYSAEGILTCDITHTEDASRVVRYPFGADEMIGIAQRMAALERRILAQFDSEHIDAEQVELTHLVGMRFGEQMISLEVPFELATATEPEAGRELARTFMQRYAQFYGDGAVLTVDSVELELHRVVGTHATEPLRFLPAERVPADPEAARVGTRSAYFEGGFVPTPVYSGESLQFGNVIEGPSIIERMGDSVIVPPGFQAEVDGYLNLRLLTSGSAPAVAESTSGASELFGTAPQLQSVGA